MSKVSRGSDNQSLIHLHRLRAAMREHAVLPSPFVRPGAFKAAFSGHPPRQGAHKDGNPAQDLRARRWGWSGAKNLSSDRRRGRSPLTGQN